MIYAYVLIVVVWNTLNELLMNDLSYVGLFLYDDMKYCLMK